uniref:RING-type E3 ubiquitin transferase n=1 Tax=Solanum lycopersicum TaxID=4081 RepID=A0A3Q7EYF3_SOLLC
MVVSRTQKNLNIVLCLIENLNANVADNLYGQSEAYMEEREDEDILRYFNKRIHHVVFPKDGVKNPTNTKEICSICLGKFKHEETIGKIGCEHEYHACCIRKWLLRKKNCPIWRASVSPFP